MIGVESPFCFHLTTEAITMTFEAAFILLRNIDEARAELCLLG